MITTPVCVTPAMRFNADRVRRDLSGTPEARAIDKAQHVESRPANYTEPMLRWAEALLVALWEDNAESEWTRDLLAYPVKMGWL